MVSAHHSLSRSSLPRRFITTAFLASVLVSACSNGSPDAQQGGMPPALVELQTIDTATVQNSSEFVGALEAQERATIRPETDGRVVAIFAQPGQVVDQGTPILELSAEQNEAEVSGAAADVTEAQAAVNTARARLKSTQAERDRAVADVQLQTSEYERIAQLQVEGAASRQDLDRATNQRDTAIAAQRAAEEDVSVATAELAEAQARLERAQADRTVAGANLRESRIVAPIAGVVGNIPVKVGDYVTTQDTLTNIIQNQSLDLNISVPIERSGQLRVGLPVELLDEQGRPLGNGRISFVSPEVNTTEQSILAKASFPNDGRLKDGQFVRARVVWEREPGVLIPTAAVTRIAGQTFVYVAEAGEPDASGQSQQVARQRLVELGAIQGNSYQVLSGLKPGEKVVTSGVLNLMDGAPITLGAPGESPSPAASPNQS